MCRIALVALVTAACGRFHFDPLSGDGGDGGGLGDGVAGDGSHFSPTRETYVKASNTDAGDRFAFLALAADGNTLAVGAPVEYSNATGIDGNQADNSAISAGAVYVFVRGAGWTQQAYVKASNTDASDQFGGGLALSLDGNTLVVGASGEDSAATGVGGNQLDNTAPSAGAAYVFTRSGTTWTQTAYLKASNTENSDGFGGSIAISDDGDTLVIGAAGEDSAATGVNGNQLDNTKNSSGAAYVFRRTGGVWSQEAYVKASNPDVNDNFGRTLVLSGDGNTLAAGVFNERSAATGIDGNQLDNSAIQAGAVYVFARAGTVWSQEAYVKASNTDVLDSFGAAIGLSFDGNTMAVGAFGEASTATGQGGNQADNSAANAGAVYIFDRAGTWSQTAYLKAPITDAGDELEGGIGLSHDGATLVVGAAREDGASTGFAGDPSNNAAMNSGAALVFVNRGGAWFQQAYLKATNTEAGDTNAALIAISADGSTVVMSSLVEASSATGIDGNGADNAAANAGAVYVFD